MEPTTMMLIGGGLSAAGTAGAGSMGGGGKDDAAQSSYDPNMIASNVVQSMIGTQNVTAPSLGEAQVASQYTWPQQYYSETLLPIQYNIEKERLANLYNTQQAGVNYGLNSYFPIMEDYTNAARQYGIPALQKGLQLSGKSYDEMSHLLDLARPVNDQTQQNRLAGLTTLQNLQNEANNMDVGQYASQAYADTLQQYNQQPQQLMQQMAALGISPDSGAATQALASLGTEKAGALGQAWTSGRNYGEETKFNRRSTLAGANAGLGFDNTAATAAQLAPQASNVLNSASQLGQGIYNFGLGAGAAANFPYYKPASPTTYSDVAKNLYYSSQPMSDALKYSQTSTGASQSSNVMGSLGTMASGVGGRMFGSGLDKWLK